jgi:hypothetical protein
VFDATIGHFADTRLEVSDILAGFAQQTSGVIDDQLELILICLPDE